MIDLQSILYRLRPVVVAQHQFASAGVADAFSGISTEAIDVRGDQLIRQMGCIPNFLHYNGYPASICVSVNDEVVHGIPSKHRIAG